MYLKRLSIVVIAFITISCGGNTAQEQSTEKEVPVDSTQITQEKTPSEVSAVSVWDKVSVRATPSDDGKWLTSLSLGESLTYLGEEKTDGKDHTYLKVKLNDGTEGWSRTEFVIPEAKAAVFTEETNIYDRPDLLTRSDDKFSAMDIVAVKNTDDDWIEIVGKPTGEKWLKSGWVKKSNVSYEDVDIAMAKFAKPVIEGESADKAEQLQEILNNQDLTASTFTSDVKEALDEIKLNEMETNDASTDVIEDRENVADTTAANQ